MIVAIDPGLDGAIVAKKEQTTWLWDMPTHANGKGKAKVKRQVNAVELAEILKRLQFHEQPIFVFIEKVSSMPGQGSASIFSLGDTVGCIRGICAALGYPTEFIASQSWKKHFRLNSDKEVCRAYAIQCFPDQNLSRKKDHNRAEALLILKYIEETKTDYWHVPF